MKRTLVLSVFAFFMLFNLQLFAATEYVHPADDPAFSIVFPDKWNAQVKGAEISVLSPDEAIEIEIWPLDMKPGESIDKSLEAAAEEVDEIIADYVTNPQFKEPQVFEVNGVTFLELEGSAKLKEDGSDLLISVAFFSPNGKSFYVMMFWGDPESTNTYTGDLKKIMKSVRAE